jgi:putative flippase GtrA
VTSSTHTGWRQFARFLVVGAINTIFGYSVFAVFIWAGLAYPAAIGLATILGVAFNFQSTGRLVFGGALAERLPSFLVVYGLGYAVNVGAVAILLSLGLNVYAANAVTIAPLAMLTFLLQRRFVFQTS